MADEFTAWLSTNYNLQVESQEIQFGLLSGLEWNDVLLLSQDADTLVYIEQLKVKPTNFSFTTYQKVYLQGLHLNMTYQDSIQNAELYKLVQSFSGEPSNGESNFAIQKLWLNDAKILYGEPSDVMQFRNIDFYAKDMSFGEKLAMEIQNCSWSVVNGQDHEFSASLFSSDEMQYLNAVRWKSEDAYLSFSLTKDLKSDFTHLKELQLQIDQGAFAGIYNAFPDSLSLNLSTDIELQGTNVKTNDFRFSSNFGSTINADIAIENVFELDRWNYDFQAAQFRIDKKEWLWIEPLFNKSYLFAVLGSIEASGNLKGSLDQVNLSMNLDSEQGAIEAEVSVDISDSLNQPAYEGNIDLKSFNLNAFSGTNNLGEIDARLNVKGEGFDLESFNTKLAGSVASLHWNGYDYENIELNGRLKPNHFSGELAITDSHLEMDFSGDIDFSGEKPKMDFVADIIETDLVALQLDEKHQTAILSTLIEMNLTGNNWGNIEGDLDVLFTTLETEDHYYHFDDLSFSSIRSNRGDSLLIRSAFAEIDVVGQMNIPQIFNSVNAYLKPHFPLLESSPQYPQDFTFDAVLYNTKAITELFVPQMHIGDGTLLTGSFNNNGLGLQMSATSPVFKYANLSLEDLSLSTQSDEDNWSLSLKTSEILSDERSKLEYLEIDQIGSYGDWRFALAWAGSDSSKFDGIVKGDYKVGAHNLNMAFEESQFYFADTLWTLSSSSSLAYLNDRWTSAISFETDEQRLDISHKNANYDLHFHNFATLNFYPWMKDAFTFLDGKMNGNLQWNDRDKLSTSLSIDSTMLNDYYFGDMTIDVLYDKKSEAQSVQGAVHALGEQNINFSGLYLTKLDSNNFNLDIDVNHLDLAHIEMYVDDVFDEFSGGLSGDFNFYGELSDLAFEAAFDVDQMNISVPSLNSRMESKNVSKMYLTHEYIDFEGLLFDDGYGGEALLSGELFHDYFTDFSLGLTIDVDSFLCLNTDAYFDEAYYGKGVATGDVSFLGPFDAIEIAVNAKAEKGTDIYIPLDDDENLDELNFVHFVERNNAVVDSVWSVAELTSSESGLAIDLNLEFNQDATINLIFDEALGDKIHARGNGFINVGVSEADDIYMFGEYILEEGDYLFTLQNFANKKFEIENGASISWDGNPYQADMNLNALYKLNTNISPLSPEYNRNADVECRMLMTGSLLKPDIEFDIQIPSGDDLIKRILDERTNTEEKNTQQFLSLLVLNNFMSSDELENTDVDYLSSTVSTGIEVLNNQLSNWTSQFTDRVDLGIKYNPSLGDTLTNKEFELLLNNMKVNDRITLNGNIGTLPNQDATRFIGDLKVEYRLSDDGKLRLVAFRNLEESFELQADDSNYTTGLGVFYRAEFDDFTDLWNKFLNMFRSKSREI